MQDNCLQFTATVAAVHSLCLLLQSTLSSFRMDSPVHYFEFIQKTYEGKVIVDVKVHYML